MMYRITYRLARPERELFDDLPSAVKAYEKLKNQETVSDLKITVTEERELTQAELALATKDTRRRTTQAEEEG